MYLTEKSLGEIKKHTSKFVSFKFLDEAGVLQQFDGLFDKHLNSKFCINEEQLLLKPFFAIQDPFRSVPTTSLFCENLNVNPNFRAQLPSKCKQFLQQQEQDKSLIVNLWQSFFVIPLEDDANSNYMLATDPADKLADMRGEIFGMLHENHIDTTYHFHGESKNESVIGITDNDIVRLADKIIVMRYIVKNVALAYGYEVNFYQNESINFKIELFSDNILCSYFGKAIEEISQNYTNIKQAKSVKLPKYEKGTSDAEVDKMVSIQLTMENNFNPYLLFTHLMSNN